MKSLEAPLPFSLKKSGFRTTYILMTPAWIGAMHTLFRTWKQAMQTFLRTLSGHIVSGTNKLLKLQFLLIEEKKLSYHLYHRSLYDLYDHF